MTLQGIVQTARYLTVLRALLKPLGWYMAQLSQVYPTLLDRVLGPVERWIYRLGGVRRDDEMNWKTYAVAALLFNVAVVLLLYVLQRL